MSKRVPVKRVNKDHKSEQTNTGVIQPILYPGKRAPDTGEEFPPDENRLRAHPIVK